MATTNKLLSIIVPFYNGGNYLERCLYSLLNQGLNPDDHEVLFIDDGSTDDSLNLLAPYLKKYVHIQAFTQKNQGAGAARNHGIRKAQGEYLYFLDIDDYLARESLPFLVDLAIKSKLDILGFDTVLTARIDDFDPAERSIGSKPLKITDGITFIAENTFRNEPWWYLVNRTFLLERNIRFLEGQWMEDTHFIICALLAARRVSKIGFAAHRYVQTPVSAMRSTEASHVLKVMNDIVDFCAEINGVLKDLEHVRHPRLQECKKRIKVQQEACVYFGIVRAYRAQVPFTKMKDILIQLKDQKVYPLKNFIGDEFNERLQKTTVFIFNRPWLLQLFWGTYPLKKKLYK